MTEKELRAQTACFLGEKQILHKEIEAKLNNIIENLIAEKGFTRFVCDDTRGFADMAAGVVLSLKKKYPEIQLIYILPETPPGPNCPDMGASAFERYAARASNVIFSKNQFVHMLALSSFCVTYVRGDSKLYALVKTALWRGITAINILEY